MSKAPCSKCGTEVLSTTLERTGGFCMPCSNGKKKRPLLDRLSNLIDRFRNDPWHTSLPNAKNFEELEALTTPRQVCDCCEFLTLSEKGVAERCGACAWVDQTDSEQDLNDGLSLRAAKKSFDKIGACHERYFMKVRMARYSEIVREEDRPENKKQTDEEPSSQIEPVTEANEALVSQACEKIMRSIHVASPVTENERAVHDIRQLLLESASGESIEQYFRWADQDSITRIAERLRAFELDQAADIVQSAIDAVFPDGCPRSDEHAERLLDDLSDQKLNYLEQQYLALSRHEGQIVNRLAKHLSA